jgi:hypothetical protein
MSQNAAGQATHAKSGDEDADVVEPRARPREHRQGGGPHQPVGRPAGDGGVRPDEPDEEEFELIGDNDLGAPDLGPADPNAADPDAGSGPIRKITRASGHGTGSHQQ